MGRCLKLLPFWLVLILVLGCGTTSRERGETGSPAGVDGPYAGADAMPASEHAEIKAETMEQRAEGGFAQREEGAGEAEERHAGLGWLFYFYVGLGIVLLAYLIWLVAARPHRPGPSHQHEELTWRLK